MSEMEQSYERRPIIQAGINSAGLIIMGFGLRGVYDTARRDPRVPHNVPELLEGKVAQPITSTMEGNILAEKPSELPLNPTEANDEYIKSGVETALGLVANRIGRRSLLRRIFVGPPTE